MEKYTLQRGKNFLWTCTDNESGLVITFREGALNETQNINIDNLNGVDSPMEIPRLLTGMADWLTQYHSYIVYCDITSRRNAIRTLANERYWMLLADLLGGHILDSADNKQCLLYELEDADDVLYNECGVNKEEIIYHASNLTDTEAHEVFAVVEAFWQMACNYNIEIDEWARDLLWWPAFMPQDIRETQDAESFGRELRNTRQTLGITLQELSDKSGVDLALISKIENGKANPTLQNILKIANAMGCDLILAE